MPYWELRTYQQATMIYDFTVAFCRRYLRPSSRTVDQMEQAARSGKQNIVEGSSVSRTAPKSELMLLGVARGSLAELVEDYRDFLRQRQLAVWGKDDPRALAVRRLASGGAVGRTDRTIKTNTTDRADRTDRSDRTNTTDRTDRTDVTDLTYAAYAPYLLDPEQAGNAMVALISQTTYLLDHQLEALRRQMEQKGVALESHDQRIRRVWWERRQRREEFDRYLRTLRKDKTDRTDKTDKTETADRTETADKTNRTDRTDKMNTTDTTNRTDMADNTDKTHVA